MRKRIFEGSIYILGLLIAGVCLYVLTTYRPSAADLDFLSGSGTPASSESVPGSPVSPSDAPYP